MKKIYIPESLTIAQLSNLEKSYYINHTMSSINVTLQRTISIDSDQYLIDSINDLVEDFANRLNILLDNENKTENNSCEDA